MTALLGGNAFVWGRNGLVRGLAAANEVLVFLPSRLFPAGDQSGNLRGRLYRVTSTRSEHVGVLSR